MKTEIEVRIRQDFEPMSPREWDNYGIMVCGHRRYNLGDAHDIPLDSFNSWEEVEDFLVRNEGAVVILPLYLYDHSGISMSTQSFSGRAHHADWDSGQVGFIYATRESIKKMQGWTKLSKERLTKVEGYLRGEVEEYDKYLRGDVWGYEIIVDDVAVDSCWGIFGEEYAKEEAISNATYCLTKALKDNLEVEYA